MPVPGAAYESESVIEADDFYPYGAIRIDTKSGGYGGEKRKYAATEYDSLSGLNHAMARYQNPTRGQFISEDPVFVGDPKDQNLKDPQGLNSARTMGGSNSAFASGWNGNTQSRGNSTSGFSNAWLRDPQGQNSYAYGRANPIRDVDPQGDWYKEVLTSQQSLSSFQIEVGQAAGQLSKDSAAWNYAIGHPVEGGAAVGLGSGLAAHSAASGIVVGAAFNPTLAVVGAVNAYSWGQTTQSYFQWRGSNSATASNQVSFQVLTSAVATAGTMKAASGT